MIVIQNNRLQGISKDTTYLTFRPILSGEHIGKFATNENALIDFSEVFQNEEYELIDLDSSVFEVNTTAPQMHPFACEIPAGLQLPFRNGLFKLNGFEVPLETINDKKVVNIAYLLWKEFRAELDRKDKDGNFVNQALKDALMDLWDFVEIQANTIGPWMADPINNQLSNYIIYLD